MTTVLKALLLCLFCSVTFGGGAADAELRAQVADLQRRLDELLAASKEQHFDGALGQQGARHLEESDVAAMTASVADMQVAMDHMWLILCGALVMFMQAGFAMLCAGCCRFKNVQNILLKNLSDVCIGTLSWWALGWGFAYGPGIPAADDGNKFAGTGEFFGIGFNSDPDNGLITSSNKPLNWYFQWAFCSAAATIVSGAVAERVNFFGYAIYSATMTAFIYPVVVAWTWGYGWLSSEVNDANFIDFAGSGVVHLTGGVAALVGAIVAGPRKNRWERPEEFAPHSLPLVVLGTFLLWFGWYGFNCGSTLSMHTASKATLAAQVAMNTTIAAATGGLTVFFVQFARVRLYDIGALCNGILAGLVSITAGCGNVESGSAFVIGMVGGLFYIAASTTLKKLKIDDPLDAFPVHGACGAWGTLAAALFDFGKGFDEVHGWSGWSCMRGEDGACLTGMGGQLVVANLVQVLAVSAWTGTLSLGLFMVLRTVGLLRADDDRQDAGLDSKHSPSKAYELPETQKPDVALTDPAPEHV